MSANKQADSPDVEPSDEVMKPDSPAKILTAVIDALAGYLERYEGGENLPAWATLIRREWQAAMMSGVFVEVLPKSVLGLEHERRDPQFIKIARGPWIRFKAAEMLRFACLLRNAFNVHANPSLPVVEVEKGSATSGPVGGSEDGPFLIAMSHMILHPEWSVSRVAKEAGIDRTKMYRHPLLRAAIAARRQTTNVPRTGFIGRYGNVDAEWQD